MSLAGFPTQKQLTFTYADDKQGDMIEHHIFHSAATRVAGYESKCLSRRKNE
jgi:hypothetical protein